MGRRVVRVLSRKWFLLLALLAGGLWPAGGAAVPGDGAPSLTATVDPEEVPLGGRVVLTVWR